MKKNLPTLILALLILAIAILASSCNKDDRHICSQTDHVLCDGECECDGMECPGEVIILKKNVDERGLISVEYTRDYIDTFALDYLTPEEYLHLLRN